jgi:hypothetical protein
MISLTLMSKGEKMSGLDATVADLSRTVQSIRVSINAKGGDCWHVYRQSVLVINGKNNNDVGMFTCRVCLSLMARSECASMEKQEQRKLR